MSSWEMNHGFDSEGHERRHALFAYATCPRCGDPVELIADTVSWTQGAGGLWHHDEYGPAQGICCGLLIVDSFEGAQVSELKGRAP